MGGEDERGCLCQATVSRSGDNQNCKGFRSTGLFPSLSLTDHCFIQHHIDYVKATCVHTSIISFSPHNFHVFSCKCHCTNTNSGSITQTFSLLPPTGHCDGSTADKDVKSPALSEDRDPLLKLCLDQSSEDQVYRWVRLELKVDLKVMRRNSISAWIRR